MPLRLQTVVAGPTVTAPGALGSNVTVVAAATSAVPSSSMSQATAIASPLLNCVMMLDSGMFGLPKNVMVGGTGGIYLKKVMTSLGGAAQPEGSFGPSNLGY